MKQKEKSFILQPLDQGLNPKKRISFIMAATSKLTFGQKSNTLIVILIRHLIVSMSFRIDTVKLAVV